MGTVYQLQGRYDEALDAYDRSLAISREFEDRVGEGQTLISMGNVYQLQGRYDEALDAYDRSLAICREFKDRVGEGLTLNNMGVVYQAQGRYDEALDAYGRSLAICREFKDRVGEGRRSTTWASSTSPGPVRRGPRRLRPVLAICASSRTASARGRRSWTWATSTSSRAGTTRPSTPTAGPSPSSREFKDRVGEGQTLENLALLSKSQDRLPEAIEWARQAVAVLEATEARVACERARRTLERLERLASEGPGAGD